MGLRFGPGRYLLVFCCWVGDGMSQVWHVSLHECGQVVFVVVVVVSVVAGYALAMQFATILRHSD